MCISVKFSFYTFPCEVPYQLHLLLNVLVQRQKKTHNKLLSECGIHTWIHTHTEKETLQLDL